MPDVTLEGLIEQQINLGHTDPHDFPDLVRRALGEELIEVVQPHLDDFIAEMARHRLGALRRASVARITPSSVADSKTLTRSLWVPTYDGKLIYKRIGEMTAGDFDARADYLDRMSLAIRVQAEWCRDCSRRMRAEGVKTARRLSALPPLPDPE